MELVHDRIFKHSLVYTLSDDEAEVIALGMLAEERLVAENESNPAVHGAGDLDLEIDPGFRSLERIGDAFPHPAPLGVDQRSEDTGQEFEERRLATPVDAADDHLVGDPVLPAEPVLRQIERPDGTEPPDVKADDPEVRTSRKALG